MEIIKSIIHQAVVKIVQDQIKLMVTELKQDKSYILVLPEDLDTGEIKTAFEHLKLETNIVVLQSDHVKIIELT